jgi:aspartate carbamoyltransferase regulatory subunit
MNNKRTELKVSAIENGTVIDHIKSENTFRVFKILELEESKNQVYFGTNLSSKKLGKKGIIKISGKYFKPDEINKIALVAPNATLIEIKNYDVINKSRINLPNEVENIAKCKNPKCVTNNQNVNTKFKVITDHHGNTKLACHYCEKTFPLNETEFI